jgi:hypothetical protein
MICLWSNARLGRELTGYHFAAAASSCKQTHIVSVIHVHTCLMTANYLCWDTHRNVSPSVMQDMQLVVCRQFSSLRITLDVRSAVNGKQHPSVTIVAPLAARWCWQATMPPHFLGGGYLGGRNPIGWPHTIQLGEPNCRGSEALPHQ